MESPQTMMEVVTPRVHQHDQTKAHPTQKVGMSQSHSHEDDAGNNSSVQVAIRVRPLMPHEDNGECVQLFSNNGIAQTRPNLTHGLQSKSSSESTIATVADSIYSGSQSYQTVQVGSGDKAPVYTFDHVFPSVTEQKDIYDRCVTPLVNSCLEGYNATVLAYGQTGSGKTHTILGDVGEDENDTPEAHSHVGLENESEGVIPRALRSIFNGLAELKASSAAEIPPNLTASPPGSANQTPFEYSIKIQFVELYGEEIRDLLDAPQEDLSRRRRTTFQRSATTSDLSAENALSSLSRNKITIRDGRAGEGAELLGTVKADVKSVEEALSHLRIGLSKRIVRKTAMNAHSSRSHAIFSVVIHQTMRRHIGSIGAKAGGEKFQVEMKTSKIHFVDLCGSERAKKAQTVGKRLKEGIDINKGLLTLGNVISALGKNGHKGHVPYRNSKLTRILKGSLGGNHKTLMIACVSPSPSHASETVNALRYANRAKNIKNNAKINTDPQHQVVHELQGQVAALAAELLRMRRQGSDDEEDCPFSLDFLSDLVNNRCNGSNAWRRRQNIDMHALKNKRSFDEYGLNPRPSTSPEVSKGSPERTMQDVSWDLTPVQSFDTQREEFGERKDNNNWDADSAENPELAKNIESYDFALTTLRQSVAIQSLRFTQKSPFMLQEEMKRIELDGEGSYQEGVNEVSAMPSAADQFYTPGSPPPALKKIKNINELYDYLNKNTYVNEQGDIVDDDGTDMSEVVNSHVSELKGAISQNERLLKEMETSNEIFQTMKSDNIEKLAEIELDLQLLRKEKQNLATVHEIFEGESQHSKGLEKALAVKENLIAELLEERDNLLKLNERTNENLKSMRDLKSSIGFMKKNRGDLSKIKSRPRSRGITPTTSFDVSEFGLNRSSHSVEIGLLPTPEVSLSEIVESVNPVPFSNESNHDLDRSKPVSIDQQPAEDRHQISTWDTDADERKEINDLEIQLAQAGKYAVTNAAIIRGRRVSNVSIPSILETNLDATGHSNVSELGPPTVIGSDHGLVPSLAQGYRQRSNILETHYKDRQRSMKASRSPRTVTLPRSSLRKHRRRARESRPPASVTRSDIEPLSYRTMFSKRSDYTQPAVLATRSVFDVVDESASNASTSTSMCSYRSARTHSRFDYGDTGNDWFGVASIFDVVKGMVGLKNPVLRQWDA